MGRDRLTSPVDSTTLQLISQTVLFRQQVETIKVFIPVTKDVVRFLEQRQRKKKRAHSLLTGNEAGLRLLWSCGCECAIDEKVLDNDVKGACESDRDESLPKDRTLYRKGGVCFQLQLRINAAVLLPVSKADSSRFLNALDLVTDSTQTDRQKARDNTVMENGKNRLQQTQEEVEQVKDIMLDNLNKAEERTGKLGELEDRADVLLEKSKAFEKTANKVKQKKST
ncbi:vesicle-associated membrane protein 5-like [Solea senegalensis]|uniref:Vesicle-associated membrane protein 5-like n=1 Tax=Solea senegalensis TaxID=28829 RepID=A0AAV6QDN9_SOLSE|nr:vesicle-associated membrane protein 5-like [Solea senegalensis]